VPTIDVEGDVMSGFSSTQLERAIRRRATARVDARRND